MTDLVTFDRYGRNALHKICAKGDFAKYTDAIDGVTDFTARTNNGSTYLHYAVTAHSLEICKDLVEKGLDPIDPIAPTPFHTAAEIHDVPILTFFLDRGISPNGLYGGGMSPLARACSNALPHDGLDGINLLLSRGAEVNFDCDVENGATPLYFACQNDSVKLVDLLLSHGADVNAKIGAMRSNLLDELKHLTGVNHKKIVKMLKAHGAVETPLAPHLRDYHP